MNAQGPNFIMNVAWSSFALVRNGQKTVFQTQWVAACAPRFRQHSISQFFWAPCSCRPLLHSRTIQSNPPPHYLIQHSERVQFISKKAERPLAYFAFMPLGLANLWIFQNNILTFILPEGFLMKWQQIENRRLYFSETFSSSGHLSQNNSELGQESGHNGGLKSIFLISHCCLRE